MNRPRIAIIGAGSLARIYCSRCRELGIVSHCFAWAKGAVAREEADHFHDISIYDTEAILATCRKEGVAGVLCTTERTIAPAAELAEALGVNGNTPELARRVTDKLFVRHSAEGLTTLRQPRYKSLNISDINTPPEILFPLVVKPSAEGGKRGVMACQDEGELREALDYARQAAVLSDTVLLEEMLTGPEYSVETLSFHGRHHLVQITEKDSSGPPHFVELGHHQPAALAPEMWERVRQAVTELLDALGFQEGPCHTEVKVIGSEVYLIELNARPGGDHITYPLTELSTGYPYITAIILAAMGILLAPERSRGKRQHAGVYFVTAQTAQLLPTLLTCEGETWCYERKILTPRPQAITTNADRRNYFIYTADRKLTFTQSAQAHSE